MNVTIKEVTEVIINIAKAIELNKQYLTDLDAAIGDADHGSNMNKGFTAVREKLTGGSFKDIGEVLKVTGMTLVSIVGGASGPLYGTAFMKAGMKGAGKETITLQDFLEMFNDAIDGVKLRGKAELGDKTMIDVLIPTYEVLKESSEAGESSLEAFRKAAEKAMTAMEGTKNIPARKGRASYLGERSIGHQDPGATSSYLMINTIYEYLIKRGE